MTYPDPATDPAAYILAVADLREQRAKAATSGPWIAEPHYDECYTVSPVRMYDYDGVAPDAVFAAVREDAEHIAAEANPGHALKEVALWRGIAERHRPNWTNITIPSNLDSGRRCYWCHFDSWPCPDLLGAVEAAKAYADGAP